jgi:ribosomal protein L14
VRDRSHAESRTSADGSYVRFDSNAAVIIDADNNPSGRVFSALWRVNCVKRIL